MDKFQYIFNDGVSSRFIFFTVGTSFFQSGVPLFNVSGVDNDGNQYTAIMKRNYRGEFLISNLQQVNAA